jgi:hypothetical protein
MATTILRPSSTISAGSWSVADALIYATLSDQNDATEVYNTTGNQSMTLALDDLSDDINNFNQATSARLTVRARKGGKGIATFTAKLQNEDGEDLTSTDHTVEESSLTNFLSDLADISSQNEEFISGLRVVILGTNGTQAFFAEVSVSLVYSETAVGNGTIIIPSGLIQLTSGKITL